MGRKRRRERQYLYFCLAGIIAAGWSSCAYNGGVIPERESKPVRAAYGIHLQPVQSRIEQADFDGAIQYYQDILSRPVKGRHGDLALFDLGLLYSHYANPKKDYNKSLACFSRMIREYPRSSLTEEAKILINLLETMEKAKRVDIELEEKKRVLNK